MRLLTRFASKQDLWWSRGLLELCYTYCAINFSDEDEIWNFLETAFMKKFLMASIALFGLVCSLSATAELKDCGELKDEIEKKIKGNGVASFTLTIVDKDADAPGEQVGSCEGGTKKIMYEKG